MIQIPILLLQEIRQHAEANFPEEGAGLLLGSVHGEIRQVSRILPLPNNFDSDSRARRYLIKPEDMLEAERHADELDLEILGVFHSHPNHPARPSIYDLDHALPWYSYIITSVDQHNAGEVRSWRLADDRKFAEEPLQVTE
jgi:proteasome lid subunit RPN8/RPN11